MNEETQEIEEEKPSSWERITKYAPLSISFIALLISFFNFYSNNIRVDHDVQLSVTDGPDYFSPPELGPVNFTLTVLNRGNMSEVVLGANLMLVKIDPNLSEAQNKERLFRRRNKESAKEVDAKYERDSFVLEEGDVLVWKLDGFMGFNRMDPGEYLYGARVFYLGVNGYRKSENVTIGTLTLGADGTVTNGTYKETVRNLF